MVNSSLNPDQVFCAHPATSYEIWTLSLGKITDHLMSTGQVCRECTLLVWRETRLVASFFMNSLFISSSCFIGEPGVFFGAYLGPIFAILLFNTVVFVTIICVLIKHSRKKMPNKTQASRLAVVRLMIRIIGVMTLFGLMWIFGALTVREASTTFQILFAIFNSLQGFFIFLFFCVFGNEGRELWFQVLCCGKKIPGVTASSRPTIKRRPQTTNCKLSEPSTISSSPKSGGLKPGARNTTSSVALNSSVFSESEALKEDYHINVPQVHSGAERESMFSHLAEEPQITNDEQHNNASFPEVPTHIAVHLPVLVRRSSTLRHHVETAELSFTEDNVVFINPYAKSTSS